MAVKTQNIHSYVKELFIASLKKNHIPWAPNFVSKGGKRPMNFVRSLVSEQDAQFNGVNFWIKTMAAIENDLASPYWMTEKEILDMGGSIDQKKLKGAKTLTYFTRPLKMEEIKGLRKEFGNYYTCDEWNNLGSAKQALAKLGQRGEPYFSCGNDFDLENLSDTFWATRSKREIEKMGQVPRLINCSNDPLNTFFSVARTRNKGRVLLSSTKPNFLGEQSELEGVQWIDRYSVAINGDAIKGIPALDAAHKKLNESESVDVPQDNVQAFKQAEDILQRGHCAEMVTRGNQPRYSMAKDLVIMPDISQYVEKSGIQNSVQGKANYYLDLFHEQAHATGHSSRLNRFSNSTKDSDDDYAFEELVAEMSATMMVCELGLEQSVDMKMSEAYINSWIKRISDSKDPKFIVQASSKAMHACTWMQIGQKYKMSEDEVVKVAESNVAKVEQQPRISRPIEEGPSLVSNNGRSEVSGGTKSVKRF